MTNSLCSREVAACITCACCICAPVVGGVTCDLGFLPCIIMHSFRSFVIRRSCSTQHAAYMMTNIIFTRCILQLQERQRLRGSPEARLMVELQSFPQAVVYYQAAAPGAGAAGQPVSESIRPSVSGLVVLNDPEVHPNCPNATCERALLPPWQASQERPPCYLG